MRAMGNVHHLITAHGLERARDLADTKLERQELEIAAAVLADEGESLGICHAGFALTSLPHKNTPERLWRREGHRVTLLVESGCTEKGELIGVPYGSKARMILIYLQTQALRTGSREVELGRSMKAWMTAMGIGAIGGATYKAVTEQAKRISACRLTFFSDHGGTRQRDNGAFVDSAIELTGALNDDAQPMLWRETVKLNEAFYHSLIEHPVPVSEAALRTIGNKSLSIDIYVWLAYRLHSLSKPTPVSWQALYAQFGAGCASLRTFKQPFTEALRMALAAYPDARVGVESGCIMLHPSRPPVTKRLAGAVS